MYKEKKAYNFGEGEGQSREKLILKPMQTIENGDLYYGFW